MNLEAALQFLTGALGTDNPLIESINVSPTQSGASKRKSRPVKRIITEVESEPSLEVECPAMPLDTSEPLLAQLQQHLNYTSEECSREEDENASSEVLSTGSVEDTMEQAGITGTEFLRKVAEAMQNNQLNTTQINNIFLTTQIAATLKETTVDTNLLTNGNGLLTTVPQQTSPLFGSEPTGFATPESLLQALIAPSLGFLNQGNSPNNGLLSSPLISPSPTLLQSLMGQTPSSATPTPKKIENRPPVVSQTLKASKRRLFDDDRSRIEAANMNSDERIDMSDLEAFAQTFKKQRIKFGFTQGDVGVALGKRYGTDFSQTTISRFEALNLSFKNMCKLRPLLKEWLADVETAIEGGATITDLIERRTSNGNGVQPLNDLQVTTSDGSHSPTSHVGSIMGRSDQHVKRRRKRTNLDLHQRAQLDAFFTVNPRPDHDRMTDIANILELDRDVVRVWFCNRRQKMRRVDEPLDGEMSSDVNGPLFSLQNLSALEQLHEAAQIAKAQQMNEDSDETSGSPDTKSVSLDGSNDA